MNEEPPIPSSHDPVRKTIETATIADIEGIIAVQDSRIADRSMLAENQNGLGEGFLIYKTSKEELEKVIDDPENHILLVSKEDDRVIGFALCYSLEKWISSKPKWKEGLIMEENAPNILLDKTLYFRQVAVFREKSGVGAKLELSVFQKAKSQGYIHVVGDILRDPIVNIKSIEFHTRMGFVPIGTVKDDGLTWTLVCRGL